MKERGIRAILFDRWVHRSPTCGASPCWAPSPAGTPAPVAAIFRRLVRELRDSGTLQALDVYLLVQLATALHINAEAAAQLAREGATYSDPMHAGRPAKHPAFQVWRESAATARALSALFGLSPVDRQRMIGAPDNGGGLVDVLRVLADE